MTRPVYYPTLSEEAWADTPGKIADVMMSHFLTSDYSQSYVFAGYVSSFPHILATNHGNVPSTVTATRTVLEAFFSHYFDKVNVEVVDITKDDDSRARLRIAVDFTHSDGKTYSLGGLLQTNGTIFENITNTLNGVS